MNATSDSKFREIYPEGSFFDVSEEALKTVDICINCILVHLLGMFGFTGNGLNIMVLTHHGMRTTTNLILFYLAVCDLCFSCMTLIYYSQKIVFYVNQYWSTTWSSYVYVTLNPVQTWLFFTSTYLVLILSAERMVAVCFPFHVAILISRSRIKLVVGVFVFILAGLLSPYYGATYLDYAIMNNITVVLRYKTDFSLNSYFYYCSFVSSIYVTAIITFLVLLFTLMTLIALTKSSKNLRRLSSAAMLRRAREMRSAKTSLFLSTSLICLVLIPSGLMDALLSTKSYMLYFTHNALMLLNTFKQVLYVLNSSFNFVFYVITSPKFAQTFRNIFRKKKYLKYSKIA
ncbi:allatostatin-A receptor [Biomphalaria glabrata]|nr:allatostatin-A receptor [Biomphalaria glabrata]